MYQKFLFFLLCLFQLLYSQNSLKKVTDKFGNEKLVSYNTLTNSIHRIYNLNLSISTIGIDNVDQINQKNIDYIGKKIISLYEDLIKIPTQNLKLSKAYYNKGRWYISYQQIYYGLPVWLSDIGFTIEKNGKVNVIGTVSYPFIKIPINPSISIQNSMSIAKTDFMSNNNESIEVIEEPKLYIYPFIKDIVTYYLAYKIVLMSNDPLKEYIYFINAINGDIIYKENLLINSSNNNGNVKIKFFPQHYYDTPVEFQNLAGASVKILNTLNQTIASSHTNSYGNYNINWSAAYAAYYLYGTHSLDLSNAFVRIIDNNNQVADHSYGYFTPGQTITHNWSWATDETNVYYHVNFVHDYFKNNHNYNDMDYQMNATVHKTGYDNASADGTNIIFGSVREFAKSSDVIYHEYTHNVIYHLYGNHFIGANYPSDSEADAMDEGFADYFCCSLNNDPIQGESVDVNRNLDNNYTMDDFNNFGGTPDKHLNGQIISGAVWDVRKTVSIGVALTDELTFGSLQRTPHAYYFSDFLDNFLYEDDNDASISNGTPHIDEILYAFEKHKIYPADPNIPPAKPKDFVGSWDNGNPETGHPRLDWTSNTEPDLNHYEIWKKVDDWNGNNIEPWKVLKNTTNNFYIDYSESGWDVMGPPRVVYYKIRAIDNNSNGSNYTSSIRFDCQGSDVLYKKESKNLTTQNSIPDKYELFKNYPNPFNPITKISFGLPEASNIFLKIYNIQGKEILTLANGIFNAGTYFINFDASSFSSGVYFYLLKAKSLETNKEFFSIKRMILLK
ncbi:T9SS type A sorting domain-containing protein [Calditrichota bacterium GD2]